MNKVFYLLKLIFRPKDVLSRLSLGFIKLGLIPLVGNFIFNISFSKDFLEDNIKIIDGITVTYQEISNIVFVLSLVIVIIGVVLGLFVAINSIKDMNSKDIALIQAYGFENLPQNVPIIGISFYEKNKITPLSLKILDSRNKINIINQSIFFREILFQRTQHVTAKQAYITALGSIPYLFMIGTFLRDGHLPLKIFDFDRNKNKFHSLDDYPSGAILLKFKDNVEIENISSITPNVYDEIALAIEFTQKIKYEDLPEELRNHTLHLKLNTGYKFDSLPENDEQEMIVKEISHLISSLKKNANLVNIFISAQASVVLRLGTMYQEGLHGKIKIWHWNSSLGNYEWCLTIDGGSVS